MEVAVVGAGYVGLVSAVGFASVGHSVTLVEVDARRRDAIARGVCPFHEPGLAELLGKSLREGRLRVAAGVDAAAKGDAILVCVQTPAQASGAIDLSYVERACRGLAAGMRGVGRKPVVAIRSTVVPGCADRLQETVFTRSGVELAGVAANPEFLREGTAVADFLSPDRVVIGAPTTWERERLVELYQPLAPSFVFTTRAAAELAKYASNTLWATLVSFSNQIANICEHVPNADVETVLDAVTLDRRLSPVVNGELIRPQALTYLRAGCGFGGSCLPKDLSALIAFARSLGEEPLLLDAVAAINRAQPLRVVALLEQALGDIRNRRVSVLGLAFKAGTNDLRTSPALSIIDLLLDRGAQVVVYDALITPASMRASHPSIAVAESMDAALQSAEACILTTHAPEFQDIAQRAAVSGGPIVIDGRRTLPADTFAKGYFAVGRSVVQDGVAG